MDPNTIEQILNLIDKSKNILLLTHAKADCDGLGALLSTYLVLKDLGKEVTAVTNDQTPENLAFLPSISIVQNSLASSKDFIITLNITQTPISKIKYNLEDNKVNIIITPKGGSFSEKDVSFAQEGGKFDLIIVMDAGNFEHLGPIYDKNTELFFETPVINIDHHTSNTDFGRVNMVDVVASSTTEVLFRVLEAMEKKYDKKLITEDVATLLLAGIITDTGSFQHANTSPKSMEAAARLLDLGGRQQEIIKNIYKTKKLSTLKLWGIVLSKVQVDPIYRMVWSTISREDIKEAGASPDESEGIIDDLLSNAPGAEVIMLIKDNEKDGYISVSMRSTTNSVDVGKISAEMGGGGHVRAAGYKVRGAQSFDQVISDILAKVRGYQAERLNIHPENLKEAIPASVQPASEKPVEKKPEAPKEQKPKKVTYLEFKEPEKKKETVEARFIAPQGETPKQEKKQPQPQGQKQNQQKGGKQDNRNRDQRPKNKPQNTQGQKPQSANVIKSIEKKPDVKAPEQQPQTPPENPNK